MVKSRMDVLRNETTLFRRKSKEAFANIGIVINYGMFLHIRYYSVLPKSLIIRNACFGVAGFPQISFTCFNKGLNVLL